MIPGASRHCTVNQSALQTNAARKTDPAPVKSNILNCNCRVVKLYNAKFANVRFAIGLQTSQCKVCIGEICKVCVMKLFKMCSSSLLTSIIANFARHKTNCEVFTLRKFCRNYTKKTKYTNLSNLKNKENFLKLSCQIIHGHFKNELLRLKMKLCNTTKSNFTPKQFLDESCFQAKSFSQLSKLR